MIPIQTLTALVCLSILGFAGWQIVVAYRAFIARLVASFAPRFNSLRDGEIA